MIAIFSSLSLTIALTGCDKPRDVAWSMDHFVVHPPTELLQIKSVVFIELSSRLEDAPQAGQLSQSLADDLQHRGLFNVQRVARDDFRCRDLTLDVNQPLELREMQQIRQALGCDAVVLGEMDSFQQYPRTRAGLYLRMVDLKNGKLLWGVKHTWDGSDKEVAGRIRKFWRENVRGGFEPANEELVLMSPRWFLKFVSHEAVSTLPTRDELLKPPATSDK
jgi:hypothetical protein